MKTGRDFSEPPVLVFLDQFLEVGGEGRVIAAPGATDAKEASDALERGVATRVK